MSAKHSFSKKEKENKILSATLIRASNGLDPDKDGCSVCPDLGLNCLQRLSTDNKSPR